MLKLAEELGAATAVLTGPDTAHALVAQARGLNCATLVVGRAKLRPGWRRWWPLTSISMQLSEMAPTLDIFESGRSESSRHLGRTVLGTARDLATADEIPEDVDRPHVRWPGYLWAAVMGMAVTLIATPLSGVLEQVNIVMLFLLGVVGIAMRFGRGPAALAALLNVAAFDFFFVSPRLSFAVGDIQYVVTFAVMLGVGLLVGQLTTGLRFAAGASTSRERRAQSLFELTRELSAALQSTQVVTLGTASVQGHFGGQALILVTDASDLLIMPTSAPAGFDPSVADWAFRHGQAAGLATSTLAAQPWHYAPLKAPMRVRGVLAIAPARPRWLLIPEQVQQLDTLARQIAIALERVHYVEVAQQAVVEMESERLRNTLLAALSHDVRTPLTALIGLAESLRFAPSDDRLLTTQAIVAQARQLNALVNNLLDMARLEAGGAGGDVQLRRDWQSVEEVVGSASRSAGSALGG